MAQLVPFMWQNIQINEQNGKKLIQVHVDG